MITNNYVSRSGHDEQIRLLESNVERGLSNNFLISLSAKWISLRMKVIRFNQFTVANFSWEPSNYEQRLPGVASLMLVGGTVIMSYFRFHSYQMPWIHPC